MFVNTLLAIVPIPTCVALGVTVEIGWAVTKSSWWSNVVWSGNPQLAISFIGIEQLPAVLLQLAQVGLYVFMFPGSWCPDKYVMLDFFIQIFENIK